MQKVIRDMLEKAHFLNKHNKNLTFRITKNKSRVVQIMEIDEFVEFVNINLGNTIHAFFEKAEYQLSYYQNWASLLYDGKDKENSNSYVIIAFNEDDTFFSLNPNHSYSNKFKYTYQDIYKKLLINKTSALTETKIVIPHFDNSNFILPLFSMKHPNGKPTDYFKGFYNVELIKNSSSILLNYDPTQEMTIDNLLTNNITLPVFIENQNLDLPNRISGKTKICVFKNSPESLISNYYLWDFDTQNYLLTATQAYDKINGVYDNQFV